MEGRAFSLQLMTSFVLYGLMRITSTLTISQNMMLPFLLLITVVLGCISPNTNSWKLPLVCFIIISAQLSPILYLLGIYDSSHLNIVLGHSYHTSGSVHLLTMCVAPEAIMKLRGWTSLCFLLYWHHLELIVPLTITCAWASQQWAFVKKISIANASFDSFSDMSFDFTI